MQEPQEYHSPHRKFLQKGVLVCVVILFIICGTLSITLSKTCYTLQAENFENDLVYFRKPLFFNSLMFFSMALCTFPYLLLKYVFSDKMSKPKEYTNKHLLYLFFPALLAFSATYLQNIGLVYIHGSVFQMLRGSVIIFIALLQYFIKKRKLLLHQIIGVLIVVVAIALVGSSSFMIPSNKNPGATTHSIHKFIGISCILFAQLLNACSGLVEESLLHDAEIPPSLIVSVEGWFGVLFSVVTILFLQFMPIPADTLIKENTAETLLMMVRKPTIYALVNAYVLVVLFFNLTGMTITSQINALTRNVIDPLRMITIWLTGLFIHYVITNKLGEALSWATLIQVFGFIVLAIGFFVYAGIIPLPFFGTTIKTENENIQPILQDDEIDENEMNIHKED
ncbi:hypothetical protein EHI8A_088120 [Entamoeba histolytica HM-1:IMSS-B]|uniref:EamA domain-containing protein n=7 Tax=Entamoeba histolytica TaxID=5759 RepID=C4LUG1_ENTH1|nr:hypothetical protein, conserved [Entamoeba histolytica HM-1:IMSS]EMD43466.1 Hypothetical protein EHI5A_076060 [Entamoeba histolytica KU27]EMH72264.1 hypothetical protein EHI8A_088120 [Entamoeba histolytica HM-1:IMSS-B]EMS14240.1 hypothetical protein KM1_155280 [Entamoeba histolytica HM-3:IMSS]ENY62218.1 hypothetical protein EHI7A_084530 [Entamoeba histolytica HM-1:IMSS-A]BAN38606.1 hypothetical protein, conserved [Entamoeba histolytica]|eukprot:XP_655886.1 hypothetical protein, conserved [Entamoeba histolytica HM-1:IMSS]